MDRHHRLRHLYNIPTYLSTTALPSIKKASAPMCSCVLMSGLYLRFREADNLDLCLLYNSSLITLNHSPSSHPRLYSDLRSDPHVYILALYILLHHRILSETLSWDLHQNEWTVLNVMIRAAVNPIPVRLPCNHPYNGCQRSVDLP